MTSDVLKKTAEYLTGHISTNNMQQEISSRGSSCSCPECSYTDCFKLRHQNSNHFCTCPNCKDAFPAKPYKNFGEGNKIEVLRIIKKENDNQENSFNINSNKDDANRSYKIAEQNIQADKQTNTIVKNSDSPNKISDNEISFGIASVIVNENDQKCLVNIKSENNSANKNFDVPSCCKKIPSDIKEDNQNLIDSVNKSSGDNSYHEIPIQDIKNNKQKDFHTNLILNSNKIYSTSCCEGTKTDNESRQHEQIDELCEKVKNVFPNIKSEEESCSDKMEKVVIGNKENNCVKKNDEVSYLKSTKKIVKEHKHKKTHNKKIKNDKSETNLREYTKFSYKDTTTYLPNNIKKSERSYEESYTRNYRVAMNYKQKGEKNESENPTTTLSAQIMNLPSQELKDSLSLPKTACSLNTNKPITMQDVVSKLKEIYKACSCKVCECVPGFSNNDVATKYTCCSEDAYHTYKHNTLQDISHIYEDCNQLPHSGCACYRCDRKDCRGVWKNKTETSICDCKPCDCLKHTRSFTKPCDCEPCQCIECTSMNIRMPRSVTVAPVQGNFQQHMCQCAPCDCIHCTHNYGAMASSVTREASTGMLSHGNCCCENCVNNTCQLDGMNCRCETQSIFMRKPIDRSVRDYDLRRVLIGKNNINRKKSSKLKKCDTIAMFAFSNNSNTVFNTFGGKSNWPDYEYILCNDQEINRNSVANFHEDFPSIFSNLSHQSFSACKCQHCKCQICSKDEKSVTKASVPLNHIFGYDSKTSFTNELTDTDYCKDFSNNISREFMYPLRKGQLLTPAMFEAKILSYTQSQTHSSLPVMNKSMPSKSILKINGQISSRKIVCPQNLTICHSESINKYLGRENNQPECPKTSKIDLHVSNINDVSNKNYSTTNESDIKRHDTNVKKSLSSMPRSSTKITFSNKSSIVFLDNSENKIINQSCVESNKNVDNSQSSRTRQPERVINNNNFDLFCNRISSFEKSISQLQEDISQNLKSLADIRSKSTISQAHADLHEINVIDSAAFSNLDENLNNTGTSEMNKIILSKTDLAPSAARRNYAIHFQNDNFSKGDNKIFIKRVKRPLVCCNKLRKNVVGSRVKKLSLNSDNKISEFLRNHLKENYSHGKNKLLNYKLNKKSASTFYENCFVTESKNIQFDCDIEFPKMEMFQNAAKLLSVLKKNLHVSNTSITHKGVCTIPAIEMNIKCSVKSMSVQTDEAIGSSALRKLQNEAHKLLNSPLLQLGSVKRYLQCDNTDSENNNFKAKSKLSLSLKNICSDATSQTQKQKIFVEKEVYCNSVRDSCQGLRASFLGLRRVSDHTVLVKWKMLRDVQQVQGYELQVDGRAVQKILSPTKCMAVLTCLPHCDKLLLTIRTLTPAALTTGHYPATTIVYRPREKCSRFHDLYITGEQPESNQC